MSLLMKALEKAAKDRVDTNGAPAPAGPPDALAPAGASELTLEPISAQAAASPAQRPPAPSPRAKSGAAPAATEPTMASARDSAQAAAMIRAAAQGEPGGSVVAYLRDRPLMTFGTLAALFLAGFGGYVYMQMYPGAFVAQAPRPAASAPITSAPAPTPPAAVAGSALPAIQQPVPLTSLLPPPEPVAEKAKPAVSAPAPATTPAATTAVKPAAPPPAPAAAPMVAAPAAPRDVIKVVAASAPPSVNPVLAEAYGALTAGNLESSQRLYNQFLKSDPGNIEALLGLAAIASQRGDRDTATKNYVKVIERDPRNSLAQAGLIGMIGSADPQAAESRVKELIARDPNAAYLHFTLGNTYIDQNRWPDAQQAFFQAHHLQPDNPDYAYNLAVALEHIGQARSALDYYRRAVLLATAKGHANFSTAAAQERVAKLEKVLP